MTDVERQAKLAAIPVGVEQLPQIKQGICVCAIHCPRNPYHEVACCREDCHCWCHQRDEQKTRGQL